MNPNIRKITIKTKDCVITRYLNNEVPQDNRGMSTSNRNMLMPKKKNPQSELSDICFPSREESKINSDPTTRRKRGRPRKVSGEVKAGKEKSKSNSDPTTSKKHMKKIPGEVKTAKASKKPRQKRRTKEQMRQDTFTSFIEKQSELLGNCAINKVTEIQVLNNASFIMEINKSFDEQSQQMKDIRKSVDQLREEISSQGLSQGKSAKCFQDDDEEEILPLDIDDKKEAMHEAKVLRKFRPPISKYKVPPLDSTEDMAEDEILTAPVPMEVTEAEGVNECVEQFTIVEPDSILEIFENLTPSDVQFREINSWLARSYPNRSTKLPISFFKMLKTEALLSTYKCMVKFCSYTTISERNFQKHLNCHLAATSEIEFLFHCPYCCFNGTSTETLIVHYKYHQHDKYQCQYCFYRSCNQESCWEHVQKFHSPPVIVYECPLEEKPRDRIERLNRHRLNFVIPLKCSSCPEIFYCCDNYEDHIASHVKNPETRESATLDDRIYRNQLKNNQVGLYECLFCSYATDLRMELRKHMQFHPAEHIFACKRKSVSRDADQHSIESTEIFELTKRTDVTFVPFSFDKTMLRNSDKITMILD